MAGYLLFIPGASPNAQSRDLLADVGLAQLADDDVADALPCTVGPSGSGGVVLSWQMKLGAPRFGYFPDQQEWTALAGGAWWLGTERESPITPADVSRQRLYASLTAVLRDGNEWRVPIVSELPQLWGCDEKGGLVRRPSPEFAGLIDLGTRAYQSLLRALDTVGDDGVAAAVPEAWDLIGQALALNYRLCPEIIAHLRLIDDSNFARLLLAAAEPAVIRAVTGIELSGQQLAPARQS